MARQSISVLKYTFALVAISTTLAHAQTGRIVGTVVGDNGLPLVGAQIIVSPLRLSAESGPGGRFTISNVPAGGVDVRVFRIGYAPSSAIAVTVAAGRDTSIAVVLKAATVELQRVVVTASRVVEKITDAPATITALDVTKLENRFGNSYAPVLREAKGLDVLQVGVTSVLVNGRGFNKLNNTRWLTIEDGRIAALVEIGLPIGEHTTIPKVDVANVEVLVGPGSALYGANASNGLLSMHTKDPRQFPGWTTELSGGTRSFYDAQARYAGASGRWGYKVSAEHVSAQDWTDTLFYPAIAAGGSLLPETATDFHTYVSRASGAVAYYLDGGGRVQLNAGSSLRNALGLSGNAHYQIANYHYQDYQVQYADARWFAQTYLTHSNSGDSYQLSNFTQTAARFPNLSADSVRSLAALPIDGRLYAAEIQNNLLAGALLPLGIAAVDNIHLTWGVQVRRDRVSSYGRAYMDAKTGRPILLDQRGAYAQLESPLATGLRLIVSGRYDKSNRYQSQWSPKAGLLVSPTQDQTFRLTYNKAYLSPAVAQTDLYSLNPGTSTLTIGNTDGYDVKSAGGQLVNAIAPLSPETNETWELGYKGVLGGRLYADVTGYHSRFLRFISTPAIIANPFASPATSAYDHRTGALIADANGNPLITRTAINVGEGLLDGIDASFRYYFTDHIVASSNVSLARIDTIKSRPSDPPDASQFNTSSTRMSASLDVTDLPVHVGETVGVRYVNGYSFRSGSEWGRIPTYATLDLSANYRLPNHRTTLMLQAQNIATCVGGTSTPPLTGTGPAGQATYTAGRTCGLGLRHHELLTMPAIGTMVFVGVRREWK